MDSRTTNLPALHQREHEVQRAEVFPHNVQHAELVRLSDHGDGLALVITYRTSRHRRRRRLVFLIDREIEFVHALHKLLTGVMPGGRDSDA